MIEIPIWLLVVGVPILVVAGGYLVIKLVELAITQAVGRSLW